MELFDLTRRVGLITGGNGGLGLAMARGLAKAGAHVAILARNPDKNAAALEELRGLGKGDVLALTCDVAEEEAIALALEQTLGAFGRIDACFANAGISGAGTAIPDITAEGWDRTMAINTRGAALVGVNIAYLAGASVGAQGGGLVLAVSPGFALGPLAVPTLGLSVVLALVLVPAALWLAAAARVRPPAGPRPGRGPSG